MSRLSLMTPTRGSPAHFRAAACPQPVEALDRAIIAALSSHQLSRMTRDELQRVVQASPPPGRSVRPEYLDDRTLERLAHLARLACRNRGE